MTFNDPGKVRPSPSRSTGLKHSSGQTAGYTSYLGLDRQHRRAVIVLSDVAVDPGTTNLGIELLAQHR